MKKPVVIDASEVQSVIDKCKEWLNRPGEKPPGQKRDTEVSIAVMEKILADAKQLESAASNVDLQKIEQKWHDKHTELLSELGKVGRDGEYAMLYRSRLKDLFEFVSDLRSLKSST